MLVLEPAGVEDHYACLTHEGPPQGITCSKDETALAGGGYKMGKGGEPGCEPELEEGETNGENIEISWWERTWRARSGKLGTIPANITPPAMALIEDAPTKDVQTGTPNSGGTARGKGGRVWSRCLGRIETAKHLSETEFPREARMKRRPRGPLPIRGRPIH